MAGTPVNRAVAHPNGVTSVVHPSLVLEHALRPMFSYLQAVVSPTGVYAATEDFGAQGSAAGLSERITKAAADFTRLLRSCGPRTRRDAFAEQLSEMQRLLGGQ